VEEKKIPLEIGYTELCDGNCSDFEGNNTRIYV
jgi:hypothetical protein